MPENFLANLMAMCCGLSLAVALGWNVTAGTAEWRQLAEDLCIVGASDQNATAEHACRIVASRSAAPTYLVMLGP